MICKHCQNEIPDEAYICYICKGEVTPVTRKNVYHQINEKPLKPTTNLLVFSLIFGLVGILINPLTLKYLVPHTFVDMACGLELISILFGFLTLLFGIVMLKRKNKLGWLSIILAIIIGIFALYPIFWVMTTSFG